MKLREFNTGIMINDTWNYDCKLDQIHKQAKESVINELKKNANKYFDVIGEPKVTVILVDKE